MDWLEEKKWNETWGALEGKYSNFRKDITVPDVQNVLDKGGDINARDHAGGTIFACLIYTKNRNELYDYILQKGCCERTLNDAFLEALGSKTLSEKLLRAGADPNYKHRIDDHHYWNAIALLRTYHDDPQHQHEMFKLLLGYGLKVDCSIQDDVHHKFKDPIIDEMLKHPQKYVQERIEKDSAEWVEEHPNPTADDFLAPMYVRGENVITHLVRSGSDMLDRAFPVDKWATTESIPTLTKIFAGVPREEELMETMLKFDSKLRTCYNLRQRRQEREQRVLATAQQHKQWDGR